MYTCSESGTVTLLAKLTVAENYSRIALSEYVHQFSSSVEVIGAVLVTNGSCSLRDTSIATNISTRESQSEGWLLSVQSSYNLIHFLHV